MMLSSIFKKFLGKKSKKEIQAETTASKIKSSTEKFINFAKSLIDFSKNEYFSIIKKCQNLLDTNYKLGMTHLEKGNLNDAIFRFRFIRKFWPDFYEAQYKLAYCLVLKEEFFEARLALSRLLQKDPENKNALDLMQQIKLLEEKSSEERS